ncbi:MAG: LysR family transcriptional regulator [Mesorhizobium sp.]|uniref:LysR substrate-binding domain-containing protein n=1 Tax=Mesorhizobium sp. TaxID=1871066 RepID=UPI000FE9497F|nr:LysR substrate-binding domain-containing protein [Mesorhizobium sp.]RWE25920.1 MAG: LysR family transcriptional regulator [Mesorhizobium sp.]
MKFSLRQLSYVRAAARHRSIATAAKQLSISQSSIWAAIDSFESSFSIRLFVRQPSKGLVLTPTGKTLLERIEYLLQQAETLDAELLGISAQVRGELHIGCFAPIAPLTLPSILQGMTVRYPDLRIQVLEGDLPFVNSLLDAGTVDVILSYDLGLPSGVLFEKLGQARPHAIFASDHPLASQDRISLRDLGSEPMILLDLPESRTYFDLLFKIAEMSPNIIYRTGSYETLRSFVSAGLGFSILNLRPQIDHAYTGKQVACVPFAEALPMPSIGVGLRPNDYPSPALKEFVRECRRFFTPERCNRLFVT